MKILIVDDSNLIRRVLTHLLEQEGCEVHGVENGEDAVRRLLDEPFDAVVTDYRMPRMSGLELTATLRTLFGDQIQVVGMSASEDCRSKFENAGVDAFFYKPPEPKTLKKLLSKLEKGSTCPPNTAP